MPSLTLNAPVRGSRAFPARTAADDSGLLRSPLRSGQRWPTAGLLWLLLGALGGCGRDGDTVERAGARLR